MENDFPRLKIRIPLNLVHRSSRFQEENVLLKAESSMHLIHEKSVFNFMNAVLEVKIFLNKKFLRFREQHREIGIVVNLLV